MFFPCSILRSILAMPILLVSRVPLEVLDYIVLWPLKIVIIRRGGWGIFLNASMCHLIEKWVNLPLTVNGLSRLPLGISVIN